MKLQEWANKNEPEDKMLWKKGYWQQICFVRDTIPGIFSSDFNEYNQIRNGIEVISTHTSKSILLPVYRVFLSNGVKFTIRDNFHDWKVSVDSPNEIVCDFYNLFHNDVKVNSIYCEGFEREWVFGSYFDDKRKFTVEIITDFKLYTFFWLIAKYVKENKRKDI